MKRSLRRLLLRVHSAVRSCSPVAAATTTTRALRTPRWRRRRSSRRAPRWPRLADAGSIRIGTKFDQPGLGNINLETDEPEGFDVEIGKIIAGKLGIGEDDIEWVETVSANREAFISTDRVDLVIATYTINDERKAQVDFAGPYYVAGQDLLVKRGRRLDQRARRPRRQEGVRGHRLDTDPADP